MKIKFLLIAIFALFSTTSIFASFPVVKTTTQSSVQNVTSEVEVETSMESPAAAGSYDKWIALAFWFFLGGFAAHRWYAGKPAGWNILYIITLGGLFIWSIVDLINILTDNFE